MSPSDRARWWDLGSSSQASSSSPGSLSERASPNASREIESRITGRSAGVEDHLRATEEGYGFGVLLVGDRGVPHLRRAATVDELCFARDRPATFGAHEVA